MLNNDLTLRKTKSLHWYIVYLPVKAEMPAANTIDLSQELKCKLAKDLDEMFELAVPDFGVSGRHCDGHLFYAKDFPKNI
jgi:Uri superfamily endonuclease